MLNLYLSNEVLDNVIAKTMQGWAGGTAEEDDITIPQAIANTAVDNAVRVIVEWGDEPCLHHTGYAHKRECLKCWYEFQEKWGL